MRACRQFLLATSVVLAFVSAPVLRAQVPKSVLALARQQQASVLELDVPTGRTLLSVGNTAQHAAPGSTVKPFVLRAALARHAVEEHTAIHCDGHLRVAGRNLACVHPRDVTVLDARQALAESCNAYFAAVAERLTAVQLTDVLRHGGFAVGHAPADVEQRKLMGLGLLHVQATVQSMAAGYRGLALWLGGGDPAAHVLQDGMVASVESGVAHAAKTPGLVIAGKTGTVDVAGPAHSHGWFAGVVYGSDGRPARVLVVFLPQGNGRDAAELARHVLQAMP